MQCAFPACIVYFRQGKLKFVIRHFDESRPKYLFHLVSQIGHIVQFENHFEFRFFAAFGIFGVFAFFEI